jgi:mono/diheme cytochrome c family protein
MDGWNVVGIVLGLSFPLAAAPSVHDLGAQFRFSCSQCHGVDGKAKSPTGARLPGRVLADRAWLAKQTDAALVVSILEGKSAMPGFKHKLTSEDAKRMLREVIHPLARRAR